MGIENQRPSFEGDHLLKKEIRKPLERNEKVEVIRNVSFRKVMDKQGRTVAYVSGEFGRKNVELNGFQNIEEGKTYKVKVIEDTKPEDPLSGKYIVEIIDVDSDIDHRASLLERASRIRNSDPMRSVLEIVNNDPDLSNEFRMVTGRASDFKDTQIIEEERHRAFTALFSGMAMSPRGKDLLDLAIDRTISGTSDLIKGELESGNNYVPEIIIGSGVHGTIYNLTRQMYAPDKPSLTIEDSSRIGGQFANSDRALFRKNDRQRPELRDKKHIPGTKQSLTTFGEFATIQPADLGGETYPHQSTTADGARINFFLSGTALTDCKVERAILNPDKTSSGKYVVEAMDLRDNILREIRTDRIVFSSGLGEERVGLDEYDLTTKEIIAEEREKFIKGEDSKVMSFEEFTARTGDKAYPYPMRGIKKMILSGDGDGAVVAAGIALGYESQVGKTTTQLDSVEKIIWIGVKWLTKEEFCRSARARYHWLGLEFPREEFENYYHRIIPIEDGRAFQLDREGDDIVVKFEDSRGDIDRVVGDHYVYAHGFVDKTDEIVAPVSNDVIEGDNPNDIAFRLEDSLSQLNSQIYYKNGPIKKIQSIGTTDDGELIWRSVGLNGEILNTFTAYGPNDFSKELIDIKNIRRLEFNFRSAINFSREIFDEDSDGFKPIATQCNWGSSSAEIFKVGPVSKIPLSDKERRESSALQRIPQNTAAIFRYAEKVEATARRFARLDNERDDLREKDSLIKAVREKQTKKEKVRLSMSREKGVSVSECEIQIPAPNHRNRISYRLDSLDAVKLVFGEKLRHVKFPNGMNRLEITIQRIDLENQPNDFWGYKVSTDPKVSVESLAVLSRIFEDSVFGQMVNRVTSRRGSKNPNRVVFNLPINNNDLDQTNLTYFLPKK